MKLTWGGAHGSPSFFRSAECKVSRPILRQGEFYASERNYDQQPHLLHACAGSGLNDETTRLQLPAYGGKSGEQKTVGMMTDWDIAVRGVAQGKEVNNMKAADCLSSSVVTLTPDDSGDDCCKVTADNQIRRGVVVDDQGGCCGLVSQADVALDTSGRVVREVSRATDSSNSL